MINEDLFIKNIHSKNQDRISVAMVYDTLSKEAHRGCGLHYEIYESCFIGLLRDHLSELNEADANRLRRYAESKGTKNDDASYSEALEAERECRAEIYREQM
ncbi:dpoa decarboxylase [Klebsiella pneumoniae]|uniref:dpoa decarboxylase n=1 Tax=Klebsiella pneumoniae TaxID=573 RepID=UPI000B3FE6D4|nr:dpoa decarboxylase [Klebsiella pneumoniae]EKX2635347.1 dpoa decarboxylase [Klebsiella pneumoniae]KAA8849860.1 dpoa decarboxylase [Klebsiella pneumoniae]MCZ9472975.1 dpoa decarboxylase [Klebsiella pneumoniae]MCZ9590252.1 dpoa decarboxylase [Klebsiella pneumoniae]OVI06590.1 dpoa decarboxylase [Klebsiella pneumoniae]